MTYHIFYKGAKTTLGIKPCVSSKLYGSGEIGTIVVSDHQEWQEVGELISPSCYRAPGSSWSVKYQIHNSPWHSTRFWGKEEFEIVNILPLWPHSQASLLRSTNVYVGRVFSYLSWCIWKRTKQSQCFACCSTNYGFNARCVWYLSTDSEKCVVSYMYLLPLFPFSFLFWAFGYPHAQLKSFYPFYVNPRCCSR